MPGVGAPVDLTLKGGETQSFEIPLRPGEFLRLTARGQHVSVTCTLSSVTMKQSMGSLGGTGGAATLAVVSEKPEIYRLDVHSASQENTPRAVRVEVEALRPAARGDRTQADAYAALAAAKTAADFESVVQRASQSQDDALREQAVYREYIALSRTQHFKDAAGLMEREIALLKEPAEDRVKGKFLYLLGLARLSAGENEAAVSPFEEAVKIQRALEQPWEIAASLQNLAAARFSLGDCRRSLAEASEALEIRRRIQDRFGVAMSLMGEAKANVCLSDFQEAITAYHSDLPVLRELKDEAGEAVVLNDLGVVFSSLGESDQAEASYNGALRLRAKNKDSGGMAETLVNLGKLRLNQDKFRAALANYQRALNLPDPSGEARKRRGYALEGVAEAYFHLGETDRVMGPLRESIRILQEFGDRDGEAYSWQMLAEAQRSEADYQRALALTRQVGDHVGETISLAGLARLQRDSGELAAARQNLEAALALIERQRADLVDLNVRASYFATQREAPELYVDVLSRLNRAHPDPGLAGLALLASERAHARTLLDAVMGPARQPDVLSVNQIQSRILDGKTILLEYLLGEEHSYLWKVTQSSLERFDLPPRAKIVPLIRAFYANLTARNIHEPRETPAGKQARLAKCDAEARREAAELHAMVLGPVWSGLGEQRIIVVPDAELNLVPFAALGLRGEVISAPSASVLGAIRPADSSRAGLAGKVLLIADPVFHADDPRVRKKRSAEIEEADGSLLRSAGDTGFGSGFPRLPASRQEAEWISALLPKGRVKEDLDFDASAALWRNGSIANFGVIHIASHTLLDMRHPELSGIVLSLVNRDGHRENGFLRLRDIYRLHLQADLVTLSACESALGKDVDGEGLIGLSRAFLYAGARRVVASLWKVEDNATAEFMRSFYENIYRSRMTPPAALHSAQQRMRRDPRWSAPYYWAAFTLQGAWR